MLYKNVWLSQPIVGIKNGQPLGYKITYAGNVGFFKHNVGSNINIFWVLFIPTLGFVHFGHNDELK